MTSLNRGLVYYVAEEVRETALAAATVIPPFDGRPGSASNVLFATGTNGCRQQAVSDITHRRPEERGCSWRDVVEQCCVLSSQCALPSVLFSAH